MKKLNDQEIGQMRVMTGIELYLNGCKNNLETNESLETNECKDFFETFTKDLSERIANILHDQEKMFYLGRDCSNVLNALNYLLNGVGYNKIITDRGQIKELNKNTFNSYVGKFSIPSFLPKVDVKEGKIPYIQIKMAYITYLVALSGAINNEKTLIIVTRTREDASVLFEVLSVLKLGKLITFEETGFGIGETQDTTDPQYYLNIPRAIQIHYEKEIGFGILAPIWTSDLLFRTIDSKIITVETPIERFVKQALTKNFSTMDIEPIEMFNKKGNLESILNVLIKSKFVRFSKELQSTMLDKKIIFLTKNIDTPESINIINTITTVTDKLNIKREEYDMKSDIMRHIIYIEHKFESPSLYYSQLEKYANKNDAYVILIDGEGVISFCGPGEETDGPTEITQKSFKDRLQEKFEEEKEKELTPDRVQFLYMLNALIKDQK